MSSEHLNELIRDNLSVIGVFILLVLFLFYISLVSPLPDSISAWNISSFNSRKAKNRFITDALEILQDDLGQSDIAHIISDNGYKTVFSPKFAKEIARSPSFSFGKLMDSEFHTGLPGFAPFKQFQPRGVFLEAIRVKLTKALEDTIQPLSDETSISFQNTFTDHTEWHNIALKSKMIRIVAQVSSRVFLGGSNCRNPEWLRITVNYSVNAFKAAEELKLWPKIVRPLIARVSRSYRKVQKDLQAAQDIISPILEKRAKEKAKALKDGNDAPRYNDVLGWAEETAEGRYYDPTAVQLAFSLSSIHTTSDMATQAIFDLCGKEELIQALRDEIILVISEEGLKKRSMLKLQLMDSFLKESQRLKPVHIVSLERIAEDTVRLSDGTKISKGTSLMVANTWMWDERFYKNPNVFDPYRFLKMRQTPGNEAQASLVSSSPEHLGFGLGKHACPGRFFAVNEVKLILCHLLLKYDFKFADGIIPKPRKYGFSLLSDSEAKISIRRRHEEIVLENIRG